MARLSDTEAKFLKKRLEHYSAERSSNLDSRANESWELFHNAVEGTDTQFTQEQVDVLDQVGAPRISMNFMYPILSQTKALLSAEIPLGRVLPDGGDIDKAKAYVYDKLCTAIWRRAKAAPLFEKSVKEMLVCGISALIVEPKSFFKPGFFDLTIDHVSWKDLYIDPSAKATGQCFKDAEAIYVAKYLPRRKVENIYDVKLNDDSLDEQAWLDKIGDEPNEEEDNRDILVYDVYEKVAGWYFLGREIVYNEETDINGQKVQRVAGENIIRRVVEKQKDVEKLSKQYATVDIIQDIYIRRRTVIGYDRIVEDIMLPLTEYPFAVFTPDDYDSPYLRSPAEYLREPQKAANKFYQIAILNALLASNTRYMAPKGAYVDKEKWENFAAAAGVALEYEGDETLHNGGKPEVISPMPLNSAFYQLSWDIKSMMEYISAMHGPTQGDPTNAPDAYSSLQSLQAHGSVRVKSMRQRIEIAMSILWKSVLDYVQFYGNREQIMRYTDDIGEIVEVDVGEVLNDASISRYDVQQGVKIHFPTDRQAFVQVLERLATNTGDQHFQRLLLKKIIEHQDYPVTDQLLKDIDVNEQMSQQISQLEEALEMANARVQQLAKEILIEKEQGVLEKARTKMAGVTAKAQAQIESAAGKLAEGLEGEGGNPNNDAQKEVRDLG